MTYTIKSKRQDEDTLYTTVEYIFSMGDSPSDGIDQTIEVEVAHFQPPTVDAVILGITNRASSELQALLAAKKIQDDIIGVI